MGMSTGSTGKGNRRAMSEINVTPLVDVMLVLLIIFMVTAPMLQQKVPVDLPKTDDTQTISQDEQDKVLQVKADGSIWFKDSQIPLETLEHNKLIQESEEVFFYADRSLTYDLVAQILTKLKNAGVRKLNLITDDKDPAAAAPAAEEPPAKKGASGAKGKKNP